MFRLTDIRKQVAGIPFQQELQVAELLKTREPDILDISPVTVQGQVSHDQGLYLLTYTMTYRLTLPSSRSLTPVTFDNSQAIHEVFIAAADVQSQRDLVEEELVLIVEGDSIDLTESVVDNILLNLPSRVLTADEEKADELPSGQDWSVLTESQYQAQQEEQKAANNPFAGLTGLFSDDD